MTLKCTMILGDCLDVMPTLPKSSVQMVFCDLPYGVTCHHWDRSIDLPDFWSALSSPVQNDSPTLMSATQPFASHLIMSKLEHFRYDLVWVRTSITGFLQAKTRPLRCHESLLMFCSSGGTYNPQYTYGHKPWQRGSRSVISGSCYGHKDKARPPEKNDGRRYPLSVLAALRHSPRGIGRGKRWHPTQKPVPLLDWLIRTYSNAEDTVLDPTSGSGTTAVAALQSGRSVVCIERDEGYFEKSVERVQETVRRGLIDAKIEVVR